MSKYTAVYKCSICGEMIAAGNPQEIPSDQIPVALAKVVKSHSFAGHPYINGIPMQIPHKCPDGSGGLAYFAGFKKS